MTTMARNALDTVAIRPDRSDLLRGAGAHPHDGTAVSARRGVVRALRGRPRLVLRVLACVAVAFALRLPFLDDPLGSDEAGLLLVVRNFEPGSVYGDYWVDRPPLLLGYYWVADRLAGETGVRVLGCAVAACLVVVAAVAGHLLHGRSGATRAGLVAALLGSSYAIAGHLLNGMLQAATLSLLGSTLVIAATESRPRAGPRFHLLLAAAGLAGMSAALVKQSFVCGLVFGAAVLLALRWQGRLTTPQTVTALAAGLGGAGVALGGVALWAVRHGISLPDLWFSVVGFRWQAAEVMAATGMSASVGRIYTLVLAFLLSGLVLFVWLFLAAAPSLLRSATTRAYTVGVAAVLAVAVVSVVAGGSWWRHYLIQLVPAAILTAALVAGREGRWTARARAVLVLTAACSMVGSVVGAYAEAVPPEEVSVGRYLGAAAEPGDTALVTWGHPEVLLYADLESTYPHLWSLPARTLDRDLARLVRNVRGPRPPTWIVEWRYIRTWDGEGGDELARAVRQRYRLVGRPCGEPVHLLRGLERTLPSTACAGR